MAWKLGPGRVTQLCAALGLVLATAAPAQQDGGDPRARTQALTLAGAATERLLAADYPAYREKMAKAVELLGAANGWKGNDVLGLELHLAAEIERYEGCSSAADELRRYYAVVSARADQISDLLDGDLASTLACAGRFDEALHYSQLLVKVYDGAPLRARFRGVGYSNLSAIYLQAGRLGDAFATAKTANGLFASDPETHPIELAASFANLAEITVRTGDAREALAYANRARDLTQPYLGRAIPDDADRRTTALLESAREHNALATMISARALANLGRLGEATQRFAEGYAAYLQENHDPESRAFWQAVATDIDVKRDSLSGPSAHDRAAACVQASNPRPFEMGAIPVTRAVDRSVNCWAGILAYAGLERVKNGAASMSDDALLEAAQHATETPASMAFALAAGRAHSQEIGLGPLIDRFEKESQLADGLDLTIAEARGDARGGAVTSLSVRRDRVRQDLVSLREEIEAKYKRYWDYIRARPLGFADLRGPDGQCGSGLLGCNEALIQIVQSETGVTVLAMTKEGMDWAPAGIDAAGLTAAVAQLRCGLEPAGCRGKREAFNRRTAYTLYRALFGDPRIAARIASKPRWLIATNGALTALPPSVLVTNDPEGPDTDEAFAHATSWLVQSKTVLVVPSISSLAMRRAGRDGTDMSASFLGFAPQFSGATMPANALNRAYVDGVGDPDRIRALPKLLSNDQEVELLRDALGGEAVPGNEATEARVRALEGGGKGPLAKAGIIVFATHGLISGDFPFLSEPALALVPPLRLATTNPARNDGLLTASEITGFRLNANWVVLSACNTAAGATPEAEGLGGLARAFLYAGARGLLVSHWRVDDAASRFLVTRSVVLARENGGNRAEALRAAQREMIAGTADIAPLTPIVSRVYMANPSRWAPFVAVGY